MFQFARRLNLRGDARETMAWATEMTSYVDDHTDLDVSLWGVFGAPVGTFAWSTFVEGRATLVAATDHLGADDGYHDLVMKARDWITAPAEDVFRSVVYGGPLDEPPPLGSVASVTETVATTGKMSEAVGWATDMAEYGSSVVGSRITLLVNAYGDFGGITFISVARDMTATDELSATIRSDIGYVERIKASEGLFVDGSARQTLLRRLA